ncbi:hypothetical protein JCM12298_16200 [Desulfothermus naphthae]
MKKLCYTILIGTILFLWTIGNASAFLVNWHFKPDAQDEFIYEYLDSTGATWVKNDLTTNTFEEWGFFTTNSHDNGSPYNFLLQGKEVTGLIHASGSFTLGGPLNMTSGELIMYYDHDKNTYPYGDASSQSDGIYYGINDTTDPGSDIIAQFTLQYGYGVVDPQGIPNGLVTTVWEATYLMPGVFFDENGNDLANFPLNQIIAYATTNASYISNVSDDQIKEMAEYAGVSINDITNIPPNDLFISGNGQFRLSKVPEPATMFLLGSGLLGFVGVGRKRLKKQK